MDNRDVPWMLGAYEIGVLFATILYGFVLSQVLQYTQEKNKDNIGLKILFLAACILDTTHTVAIWALLYFWSVDCFGQPHKLLEIHWMFVLAFAVSPFMGAVVQSFYAFRILRFLKSFYLPVLIWFGAAVRVGFGIYRIVPFARSRTIPQLVQHHGWLLETALAINVGLDILNTGGLLYSLLRTRPTLVKSRKLVDTLSRYTIEIGLSTSVFAVVTLVVVHYRAHENFIFLGLLSIYPKLYTNSLFASLNSRKNLRRISLTATDVNNGPQDDEQGRGTSRLLNVFKLKRLKRASVASSSHISDPGQSTLPTSQIS